MRRLLATFAVAAFLIVPPLFANVHATTAAATPPDPATKVYWTDENFDGTAAARVGRANTDGTNVEVLVPASGDDNGYIALDEVDRYLYWADHYFRADAGIKRTDLTGGGLQTIISGFPCPMGVALDRSARKLYWTDCYEQAIYRANLDGSGVEQLLTGLGAPLVGSPQGIALDVASGKMYWANTGQRKIQRANLDGSHVEDLVTPFGGPLGITLDLINGHVYWAGGAGIERANLDGTGYTTVVRATRSAGGVAVDVAGGKLYWTDRFPGAIRRANLDGSGIEDVVTGLDNPRGIALLFGILPLDTTPPEIGVSVTPAPNTTGWNNTDVTVTWQVQDLESGVTSSTGCGVTSLTSETASTTVTCSATNGAGLGASGSVTLKIDLTAPLVTFGGNAGTYTVDQTVSITCSASDALSGIATSTCADVVGPAYSFRLGTATLTASATDLADNNTNASTSFTIGVTYASLCNLTRSFATDAHTADGLCAQLSAAESAAARNDAHAKAGALRAYAHLLSAQAEKTLSSSQVAILTALAADL